MRLASRWEKIWRSNAVRNLLKLPMVLRIKAQIAASPEYRRFMSILETHPLAVEGLPILKDAVSDEVFVCAGPTLPDFLAGAGAVYGTMMQAGMLSGIQSAALGADERFDPRLIIDAILANRRHLRVPAVLVGFKLTDPQRATAFLDKWIKRMDPPPVGTIGTAKVAGRLLYVYQIKGKDIPVSQVATELRKGGVDQERTRQLIEYIRSLKLTITAGVLNDYLVLSVSEDGSFLSRWGQEMSLARSDEFEPLRKRCRPSLCSISYTSTRLAGVLEWTEQDARNLVEPLIAMIAFMDPPKGLIERLNKDVDQLIDDIDFPEPASSLAFSFENRGIETYSFDSAESTSLDFSGPLSILKHRGRDPIAVYASRSRKGAGNYKWLAKWLTRAFGYFEDYGIAMMPAENRTEFMKVLGIVRPFFVSVDKATRDYLLPSTDGTEFLAVLDGAGRLEKLPVKSGGNVRFPVPRLGFACELNDAEKFTKAIELYYSATKKLIAELTRAYPSGFLSDIKLPKPEVSEVAGGKMYYYRLPWDVGNDVFPCAVLKDRLLVLASSRKLAADMTVPVTMPANNVVSPRGPAGAVTVWRFGPAHAFLANLSGSVFEFLRSNGTIAADDVAEAQVVKMHVDTFLKSLRAFREYSSTTTLEDGRLVHHSWLHVEDIPE